MWHTQQIHTTFWKCSIQKWIQHFGNVIYTKNVNSILEICHTQQMHTLFWKCSIHKCIQHFGNMPYITNEYIILEMWRTLKMHRVFLKCSIYDKCIERFGNVAYKTHSYIRLGGKPECNSLRERPNRSLEDRIKTYLRTTGSEFVEWTHFGRNRIIWRAFVNTVCTQTLCNKDRKYLEQLSNLSVLTGKPKCNCHLPAPDGNCYIISKLVLLLLTRIGKSL
jgi:uncharacterized protein YlbG (UPF0298 family)